MFMIKEHKRYPMKNLYIFLLIVILLVLAISPVQGQSLTSFENFELQRQDINRSAMLVLGGWAVGNMLTGTYGHFNTTGQAREFHQFNFMWNVVNLGIATYGYMEAAGASPEGMGHVDVLKEYVSLQNILLLNVGLNVTYMTAGFYLRERAKNVTSYHDRLRGYGNSLLLQGGFLLAFDVSLFFIHRNHAALHLYPQLESLASGGVGLGLVWQF